MLDDAEIQQQRTNEYGVNVTVDAPFRDVQYGRIYDHLEAHQVINIAVLGNIFIEIDEENLGLERVSSENIQKGWVKDKEKFVTRCKELSISIDPFEVYKYFQIQRKVFQVLGKPSQDVSARDTRFKQMRDSVKLSETKGHAMCSEYAILSTYIAQKIGEPVHLIVGTAVEINDESGWREAHAYGWIEGLNVVFDSVLAQSDNEYPALMEPTSLVTLATLESGNDIEAKKIGTNFTRFYGMEAGGFGVRMDYGSPKVE